MPYSSPKPSSVQWQAQTRIRSAPHSPTLRPRTTPPDSVEDLSFPETDPVEQLSALASAPASFQAPSSLPTIATTLPPIKPLPQPTPQRPQSPTSPKLPVSNASATKTRAIKDRVPTSSPEASAETKAPEAQNPPVFAAPEKPARKHMPKDPTRLTNGVHKPFTNGVAKTVIDNVGTPVVNGVESPVANDLQTERAASPAPQLWPPSGVEIPVLPPQEPTQQPSTSHTLQASRDSDDEGAQGRSTPEEDLKNAVIVSADTTGSSQTPVEGRRKESVIKRFLLRIFSCFGRGRRRNRQ